MTPTIPNSAPHEFNALTVPLAPGITLVEASAGTGKTFAITRLVLRLLLERRVESIAQILVVTFTEKATQELVTRIRATLRLAEQVWSAEPPVRDARTDDVFALKEQHGDSGRDIVRRALAELDDLAVSTIHGFCQRVLAESALESRIPFRTQFIEDETEPFQRAARDWARRRLLHNHDEAQRIVDAGSSKGDWTASWVKDVVSPYRRQPHTRVDFNRSDPDQALLADFTEQVDHAFESEKSRRHLLGFDDLLRKVSSAITHEGPHGPLATRIRTRFGAALIDEFQDTDQTQFPIFSYAFHDCPLFLIGDPKQSIYRFRGADIHAYLQAASSVPAENRYTLLANYRSTAAYVEAVQLLFTRAPDPFLIGNQRIAFPIVRAALAPIPPGALPAHGVPALEWWWVDESLATSKGVVAKDAAKRILFRQIAIEIVRLRRDGVPCKAIAVLVRTNRDAKSVKAELDYANIPSVMDGDADVLQSEEAEELARMATAIATPNNGWAVRSAMATRIWGATADTIEATQREANEATWTTVTDQFAEARAQWRTHGVAVALDQLLLRQHTAERLLALPDGDRRLTNIRHIVELLHDAWATNDLGPGDVGSWLAREQVVPNTPNRRELRLETDSEAVQILTIHKAKGLQFDIVFCPTLWDGREKKTGNGPLGVTLALIDEEGGAVLDLGSDQIDRRRQLAFEEEQAENVRLAYVALTRAVHRCYVGWGLIGKDKSASSPLAYLMRPCGDNAGAYAALQDLVHVSNGTMSVRALLADEPLAIQAPLVPSASDVSASPLMLAANQMRTWRMTSFTAMSETEGYSPAHVREQSSGFRGFPAGANAGIALHSIFERLDFRTSNATTTEPLISRVLERHGLQGDDDTATQRVRDVADMLDTVGRAIIPTTDFALRDVLPSHDLREWRFDLSVNRASTATIANVLAAHGSAKAQRYAPHLRTLRDSAEDGYLSGVVDLAFAHNGRWWIVDWKSNQLGTDDADYTPEALTQSMNAAHYTLQYHLYLLALHRHLKIRLTNYDPARHWGGVAYVFLRGVTGQSDHGWYIDTPTPALLDALDTAVGRRQ